MVEVSIAQLLTKAQRTEIQDYIKAQRTAKIKPMDTEYIKGLKTLMKQWRDELFVKEIDSDYLAYVILHKIIKFPDLDITKD